MYRIDNIPGHFFPRATTFVRLWQSQLEETPESYRRVKPNRSLIWYSTAEAVRGLSDVMAKRKTNNTNNTEVAVTARGDVTWINVNLSPANAAEIESYDPDPADVGTFLLELALLDFSVFLKRTRDGSGFLCGFTGSSPNPPHGTIGLSAGGATPIDAATHLMFKVDRELAWEFPTGSSVTKGRFF